MIKDKKEIESRGIEIDLTGPDGNAYVLFGIAAKLAKQLGKDPKSIIRDMESSNYEHLLKVFEDHFGQYVTLYR